MTTGITDALQSIDKLLEDGRINYMERLDIVVGINNHLEECEKKQEQKAEEKKPVFKIFLQRTYETRISVRDHVRLEIIASNEMEALDKARSIEPKVDVGFFTYQVVTIQELRDE